MGAVSRVYEEAYDGIVAQALLASVAAFVACLVLYLTGAVRVTPNLTRAIITATLGIFVLYLVGWLLSLFGVDLLFITSPTPLGIALSVGICLVAAFNLFLDFAIVERGSRPGLPRRWSGTRRSACSRHWSGSTRNSFASWRCFATVDGEARQREIRSIAAAFRRLAAVRAAAGQIRPRTDASTTSCALI